MGAAHTCDVHGPQGLYEVCAHVADALAKDRPLPMRETLGGVFACDACFDRLGLARFQALTHWPSWPEAARRAYEEINAHGDLWCNQCLAATRVRWARASGLPDPFPVYERTITRLRSDLADRLEAELAAAFSLPASVLHPGASPLIVWCGALDYPLQIIVYGVFDAGTQDEIQRWVERFLAEVGLPEFLLEFRPAEDGGERSQDATILRAVRGG